MKAWAPKEKGFTIVELLIVIVVIAILAAITIVSYNGITGQARASVLKNAVAQARDAVELYSVTNGGQYPETLADAGVNDSKSATYQYTFDSNGYTITASDTPASTTAYYVSGSGGSITEGIAPGHNLIVWDKSQASTVPVSISTGVAIDTSTFRTATSSVRIAPSSTGKSLRGTPVSGVSGQVVTVSFWMRTDSTWNGAANNSKIRFGASPGGTLLTACGYEGVKSTWTFVTCSYTLNSTNTALTISVGNDGTVGNIWLDDVSLSVK